MGPHGSYQWSVTALLNSKLNCSVTAVLYVLN